MRTFSIVCGIMKIWKTRGFKAAMAIIINLRLRSRYYHNERNVHQLKKSESYTKLKNPLWFLFARLLF